MTALDESTGAFQLVPAQRGSATDGPSAREMWAIVERAQAGEAEAFGELYDLYVDKVFRYIYRRVGYNRDVAEDLTSEVFLRALRNIGKVTWQGRDIGAWLITITRNLVVDYFKSGRVRLECPEPLFEGHADYFEGPVMSQAIPTPHEHAVVNETAGVLWAAVDALTPQQREVLIHRYRNQMSIEETAAALGRNIGQVKALTYRAIKTLQRVLPEGIRPW